jgi:AGZA family xanthine/uracil permease-like MFS transporter
VVAILFLGCLFFAPLAQSVPGFATAPALLFIGVLMIQGITHIEWDDITEAVPAFLTLVFMPFAYSIADGIAMGFISYALIKLFTGKASSVPYMVWIVAVLWVIKFIAFGG